MELILFPPSVLAAGFEPGFIYSQQKVLEYETPWAQISLLENKHPPRKHNTVKPASSENVNSLFSI